MRRVRAEKGHGCLRHPNLGVLAHLGRWFKGDTLEAEKLIAPYTRYVHVDLGMAEGGIFEHGKPYLDAALTDIGALSTLAREKTLRLR